MESVSAPARCMVIDRYFPIIPAIISNRIAYMALRDQLRIHGIPMFDDFRVDQSQISIDIPTDGEEITGSVFRLKIEFYRALAWILESEGSRIQSDRTQMIQRDDYGHIARVDLSSLSLYPFFIAVKTQCQKGLQYIVYGSKDSPLTDAEKMVDCAEETNSSKFSSGFGKHSRFYGSVHSERITQLCIDTWEKAQAEVIKDAGIYYSNNVWKTIPWPIRQAYEFDMYIHINLDKYRE